MNMLRVIMLYANKEGNEKYVLEDYWRGEAYVLNREKYTFERIDLMSSLHEVFKDVDTWQLDVYVEDIKGTKKWLDDNRDDIEADVDEIIKHLKQL